MDPTDVHNIANASMKGTKQLRSAGQKKKYASVAATVHMFRIARNSKRTGQHVNTRNPKGKLGFRTRKGSFDSSMERSLLHLRLPSFGLSPPPPIPTPTPCLP